MPVRRVRGGYRCGRRGKVDRSRVGVRGRGRAIRAAQARRKRRKK